MKKTRLCVLAATLTICGLTMVSCSTKSTEVRGVCGTLEGHATDMPMPDLSEIQSGQWQTAIVMHGTGVHVEKLYHIGFKEGRAYVEDTIDPYDVQKVFCQRLGYTIEGEQITLYLDCEPVATVTNTVTDMGDLTMMPSGLVSKFNTTLAAKSHKSALHLE